MPDVPYQFCQKSDDLWDMHHVELRDMQFNNGKFLPAKQQSIIEEAKTFMQDYIEMLMEDGLDKESAIASAIKEKEFSDPVGYRMNRINRRIENSKQLYQSFKPTTKEGYLYRGIKLHNDEIAINENLFNCKDFLNMINNLQEGKTFTMDYAPMCSGNINLASEYAAGSSLFKIKVPVGARLEHCAGEYRFPAMAQFIFNGVKELQGGMKIYDLEYVLPNK